MLRLMLRSLLVTIAAALLSFFPSAVAAQTIRTALVEIRDGDALDLSSYVPEAVKGLGQPPPRSAASLGAEIDVKLGPSPPRISAAAISELGARFKKSQRTLFFEQSASKQSEALADLEDIRGRLAEAQGTLAHSEDARKLYYDLLLKLTRAYQTAARAEKTRLAEQRMDELIRAFPDTPVDPATTEQELVELYKQVKNGMPPVGSVRVISDRPGIRLCLNGYCAPGPHAKVPSGTYSAFVMAPTGDGRVHRIRVGATETSLAVDVDFETALHTDTFVGFSYDSVAQRTSREAADIAKFAGALGLGDVFVLGRRYLQNASVISIEAYGSGGTVAAAEIGTPGEPGVVLPEQLRRVAERLIAERSGATAQPANDRAAKLVVLRGANGALVAQIEAPQESTTVAQSTSDVSTAPNHRGMQIGGWVGFAAGIAAMIGGGYSLAANGVGTCGASDQLCASRYNTGSLGIGLLAPGAALTVAGGALAIWSDGRRMRAGAIVSAVTGAAAILVGGVVLPLDGKPTSYSTSGGTVTAETRKTEIPAVVTMGIGGAALITGVALGVVDHLRHRSPRTTNDETKTASLSVMPWTSGTSSGLSLFMRF